MSDETPVVTVTSPFMDWLKHSIDRSLSVYLIGAVVLAVCFGGWTFYRAFLKKAPATTTQNMGAVDMVINDNRQFGSTFGCAMFQGVKR